MSDEGKLKITRCVRRECGQCGEPATKYQGWLLPNARSNPASKGYQRDDISWCVDADDYFCDDCHSKHGREAPRGYTVGSTWTYGDRFEHMFFHYVEDKQSADALAHAEARVLLLEKHLEIMTRGTKGEHRIPIMREVEEARAVLKDHE